jgi:pyruvate kinase
MRKGIEGIEGVEGIEGRHAARSSASAVRTSSTSTPSTPSIPSVLRTKIVCTIGPASSSPASLRALIGAGMNVARINFSHGTHEQHAEVIANVRSIAREMQLPVAILGDLQGPRIRIGDLPAPLTLLEGSDITLAPEDDAIAGDIPVTYDQLANDVKVGDRILINDGLLDLVALEVRQPRVVARVVHGGPLSSHKGINLPGVLVSAPSITEKDDADIAFAVKQGVDYLALSFVRRASDIEGLRRRVPRDMLVVAKIEKDTALANIESIMRVTDAVMVARGDLGVELPFEEVPIAQKRIIALANSIGRPVITATQMLESMIENPRPTRAEASDVANAILDGTDAVMLSAETATGQYPELAVRAMSRIITEIESHPSPRQRATDHARLRRSDGPVETEDAIAAATVAAVRMLAVPLIIVSTKSGFSARVVASHRPEVPILAITDVERTYRQLALVWGVQPELVPTARTYEEMIKYGLAAARRRQLANAGDRVVVTAGVPFDQPGTTNLMKVEVV